MKDIEQIKFEAQERALKLEIERNPISCGGCSMWQSGGDMSAALYHCDMCDEKRAKSGIHNLIQKYAEKKQITWGCAWDVANSFLNQKRLEYKNKRGIYFDEDHFYGDLSTYFKF